MGMGEPFDNTEEVLKSTHVLTGDFGLAWSPSRITVSTIGILPGMKKFLDESRCHLAVSLHSPFEEEREKLMPVNKKYPIKSILEVLKEYDFSKQRRVSFEYILFKDINDSAGHSKKLARLLGDISCRVNLIPFHQIPGINLEPAEEVKILKFQETLKNQGITTTIRKSRGQDIEAACGLLSTKQHQDEHYT
jgi:23S rRNA (adenine2503-C2)-methyltransferase